jgi:hypothetical protein
MGLTLNQQHIEYLMLRTMEIDQIRHLWRQTLTEKMEETEIIRPEAISPKRKTTEITIAEESDEEPVQVSSVLALCYSFLRHNRSLDIPEPNDQMSQRDKKL